MNLYLVIKEAGQGSWSLILAPTAEAALDYSDQLHGGGRGSAYATEGDIFTRMLNACAWQRPYKGFFIHPESRT